MSTSPQGALLVGSVNSPDAETTMRMAASALPKHLKRIPDGEVGDRFHWILFQADTLAETEGIERVGDQPLMIHGLDGRTLRVREGVEINELRFPPLGYARAARDSYLVFQGLRSAGVIPSGVRFQVSLPTPMAVVGAYFPPYQHAEVEPVYRNALLAELEQVLEDIPHEDLAIQWDCAVEFQVIEQVNYREKGRGIVLPWWPDLWAGLQERATQQASAVPADVELGYHLCYGDASEKHFVEPADTANLVRFANAIIDASPRQIDWIHLPVPIERDDEAYFAPLQSLRKPDETELYLGLIHREDGVEGAKRRITAASAFVKSFGVATECGMGRGPASVMGDLLDTHAEVSMPWPHAG